jgi:hypothetical protein
MPQPFDPEAVSVLALNAIRPPLGVGALAWRYTVFVPLEEITREREVKFLASVSHLESLAAMLCQHLNGLSIYPAIKGWGLRDPSDVTSIEFNKNVPFVVYMSATTASERYLEALQRELQRCLEQGLILVERQEVFLTGTGAHMPRQELSPGRSIPETASGRPLPPPQ